MYDRYTIVGDPHITSKSLDKGSKLFSIVEELGNPVIWLGDMLDNKEIIRGKCLNLLYDHFRNSNLEHFVLVGNHDWFNLECKDHSLRSLNSLPNVRIIDDVFEPDGTNLVLIPYMHDQDLLWRTVQAYSHVSGKVALCHVDLVGWDYGNGRSCESGLEYGDFSGYKRVISGHFHKLQQTGNFTYLGTPFSHSFGEANQDKVIGIYTVENDLLELIPTPFPRHVSLKLNLSENHAPEKMASFIDQNIGQIMRVQLFGSIPEVASFDKSQYEKWNIKFEDKSEHDIQNDVEVDESLDNKTQFENWASRIKQLDPEIIKLGVSILGGLNVR